MKMHAVLFAVAGLLVAAAAPKEDATKKDMKQIQGTWRTEVAVLDGAKRWTELVIGENTVSWQNESVRGHLGETSVVKLTYELDATQKPKEIDMTWADSRSANAGKVQLGIYQLDGDTLKICKSDFGNERPKKFESKEKPKQSFFTLKRANP